MKISEVFSSIQGEGHFAGTSMLFIRTSGCTRKCLFCDTKYHINGKEYSIEKVVEIINKSKLDIVCWTGGEPLLWREQIKQVIDKTKEKFHHIETNGDLLLFEDFETFQYLAISPKCLKTAQEVLLKTLKVDNNNYDVKVVTDLDSEGRNMLKFATILMPLSTYNRKKDIEICQKVWQYCVKHNIKYSARLQYFVWGKRKNV